MDQPITLPPTFWNRVDKTESCWLWSGPPTVYGYGQIQVNRVHWRVHRLAYAALVAPIPPGMEVDHMCHVRLCVNPSHLQAVTARSNQENRNGSQSNSKTGIRGVSWHRRRGQFEVRATSDGIDYSAGYFDNIEQAEAAAVELRNRVMTNNLADRRAS